jgi:hypothetical protein
MCRNYAQLLAWSAVAGVIVAAVAIRLTIEDPTGSVTGVASHNCCKYVAGAVRATA